MSSKNFWVSKALPSFRQVAREQSRPRHKTKGTEMQNQSNYAMKIHSLANFDVNDMPEYVVEDLLLAGEVSLLVGPSNSGKSAFAIRLSHHIVTSTQILGRDVRRGMVLYIAAEGPRSVNSRATAVFRDDEGKEHFHVVEMMPKLGDVICVEKIISAAKSLMKRHGLSFSLVVFDTLILSIGDADENSNVEMSNAIRSARQIAEALNAHVMLIHHTGKDIERGARGASSLRANVDTELLCKPCGHGAGRITQEKQRNLERGGGLGYRLAAREIGHDRKQAPITAVVAAFEPLEECFASAANVNNKPSNSDRLTAAIKAVLHERGDDMVGFTTSDLASLLPQDLFAEGAKLESNKRAVARALEELERENLVRREQDGRINRWKLVEQKPTRVA
ncbi:AAA family ATPase [Thioclava sp. F36-7]|uniref:AAA family ATPase n=1 Tax=Thioclava sp. F36-7 TaxID=1915317 RepID=UPI00099885F9